MFTGIVEEIGVVKKVAYRGKAMQVRVAASTVLSDVKFGDSISTNGVCLTISSYTDNDFVADIMPQTLAISNLAGLKSGMSVNLERALRVGDRLGGHWVSGHIDCVGKVVEITLDQNATWLRIEMSADDMKYIVAKGSIAIDGVSLTVAKVETQSFSVSLIPTTLKKSMLEQRKVGDQVNLEYDILGKYIEGMMFSKEETKKDIDMNFLANHGFL